MATLVIRGVDTAGEWQVWPQPQALPAGTVQETRGYLFELRGEAAAEHADLLIDDRPLEALRAPAPGTALWKWSPAFNAGVVDAELRIPGSTPRRFELVTDPDQRKLTRDDFDLMLREIIEDTFALFSLGGFRKAVARGNGGRAPPVARLEFLRSRVTAIESVLAQIARRPRRMLRAEEVRLPYQRALRATGQEILRSFRSGRILSAAPGARMPAALRGRLPEQIRLRRAHSSADIAEHRAIAACVRSWAAWLSDTAGLLERLRPDERAVRDNYSVWSSRCRGLARRLSRSLEGPLAEATEAPPYLRLTSLFRNDLLYNQFYRLWLDMNRGIASVFGDFLNMPLARTFELYELWCFLRLLRAATEKFGASCVDMRDLFISDERGAVTFAAGAVSVRVGSKWSLCFQKQYSEFWETKSREGSYSRPMQPDITLLRERTEGESERCVIVLDAKYRIDQALNDALSSIHMYRDALVVEADSGQTQGLVRATYLLTPYIAQTQKDYRGMSMPGRLFHPQYRAKFRFGAVTLRPGMATADIVDALQCVLRDARCDV